MQSSEYEKALLAAACWRLAKNSDPNELLAIACVVRNWVVPRFGAVLEPMVEKATYRSYSEAVADFLQVYPTRPLPDITESALIDPNEGLLAKIDSVYDCTLVDLTSSRGFPTGARYFGRVNSCTDWFRSVVLARQDVHPLIGTFGSQSFYA